ISMQLTNRSFAYMPLLLLLCMLLFMSILLSPLMLFAQSNTQSQSEQNLFTHEIALRGTDRALVTSTPTPTPIPVPSHITFNTFVGAWYTPSRSIDIEANGHAHLALRTYQWCSD